MINWRMMPVAGLAGAFLLSMSACANVQATLGLTKQPPDEFTVVRKPPLVMPPNFALRPPVVAEVGKGKSESAAKAKAALVRQTQGIATVLRAQAVSAPAKSIGEQALLTRAGAENANPGIRQLIQRETTLLEEKDRAFTERLIFWQKAPPSGQIVDAKKEAERLRQAAATGKTATTGETPIIRRGRRAILQGIF
mgnify:CR=1 FL=1|tara:strand:+ start:297 stop:881 length:585 start_codon:yes stop_codon:yes gene_type:complete